MVATSRLASSLSLAPSYRCLRTGSNPGSRSAQAPRKQQIVRCQAPPGSSGAANSAAYPDDWLPGEGVPSSAPPPDSGSTWQQWQDAAGVSNEGSGSRERWSGGGALAAIRHACSAYDRAVKTNPVLTKALTSFTGFALGDRIAQSVTSDPYDPYRCLRLSLYGLLLDGPIGHAWYKLLDKYVYPEDPTSNKAILVKTVLDQLVWSTLMTLVFFAFLKALEGHPELILSTIQQRFWPTMVANYALWPLAHLVSFKWVPTDFRILFNNAIAIFWTTYLSLTCGTASAVSGHSGGEAAVAAASALLSALPCHKVEGAMSLPGISGAVRHVMAIERMVSHWGTQSLPSTELLVQYVEMKAEVIQSVCQQPIRFPSP